MVKGDNVQKNKKNNESKSNSEIVTKDVKEVNKKNKHSSKEINEVKNETEPIVELKETSKKVVSDNKLKSQDTSNVVDKKSQVKKENNRSKKLEKLVEAMTEPKEKFHILYVSHLPWGTDETFVKKYFEQFGTINRYYLPRSKNTGRIKGYCFIEFDNNETCKIAAQTMNNYILFEKILKCQVIEDSSRFNGNWRNHYKYLNKYKVFVEKRNSKKTVSELKERVNLYLKKEEDKRKKLEELGIKYDFPGFKACLTKKH